MPLQGPFTKRFDSSNNATETIVIKATNVLDAKTIIFFMKTKIMRFLIKLSIKNKNAEIESSANIKEENVARTSFFIPNIHFLIRK